MKRNIYLKTIPLNDAVELLKKNLDRDALVGVETVPVDEALGRITAAPVIARYSSPTFHSAAMDGIAVDAEKTFHAREGQPVRLLPETDFTYVNTGHPLPEFANAVIMIENVVKDESGACLVETPTAPWQHVRRIGEDIVATEMILPRGRRLSSYDLGALLSCGIWEVEVYETLRVSIIPTGDEVLDYTTRPEPGPGQVVESNSIMLRSLAHSYGMDARRFPPVPDDPASLSRALEDALESKAHIVVFVAGSSAGSKDYTRSVIEKFGTVHVHGVAAMPGKPSMLAVCRGKLVVGSPGYPVSSVVCFEELLAPLAAWLTQTTVATRAQIEVRLARATPSRLGQEEFLRLAVGRVDNVWSALPLSRGAGMVTTLTKAQAVTRIPSDSEGLQMGSTVNATLLVDQSELERTLVVVGSHDNTLDVLADALMQLDPPIRLASSHVGSMGGITALKNKAALMAGCHLFDPDSNDFNFPFLKRYVKDMDLAVINLAIRQQGLIVARGNPKQIRSIKDLAKPGVVFINRQRGAGTRILLDYQLNKHGIDPLTIDGYTNEEFTHMAVAVNVQTSAVDCGMGVLAAARALSLDFIPVARERYDLVVPKSALNDPKIKAVLNVLRSSIFKNDIENLGGYETDLTGKEMAPGMGLGPQE